MTDTITEADVSTILDEVQSQVRDMDYTDTMGECLQIVADNESALFEAEHDSNLVPWPPLKPSTIARKGHAMILFETGRLMNSLANVGGPDNIAEAFERGLTFGTEVPYAVFHQTGTSRMPARPPVGLMEESIVKIVNNVADATVEKLKA